MSAYVISQMASDKRRRRKRARLASDSESESSDVAEPNESSHSVEDVRVAKQHESSSDDESSGHSDASQDEISNSQPQDPRDLRKKVPQSNGKFSQLFLELATQQFGEDLEQLRKAADFGQHSLAQLISGLKQGTSAFTQDQQELLLSSNNVSI